MILPAPPPLVTVSFAPLPMPQALARLSAASGERLECAPVFRDQPLFVHLHAADEERVLREIATLCNGRWERRPAGRILLLDPVAIRRKKSDADAASAKTLAGSLSYLKRRLAEQPSRLTFADMQANEKKRKAEEAARAAAEERKDYANMFTDSSADEEMPGWRAAAGIVPLLGRDTLLALANDSRTVWSDMPTPVQRLLPVSVSPVLKAYREELAIFKPDTDFARVRLIVKRWEDGGSFNVTFQAVDRAGQTVDKAFIRMNDDSEKMRRRSTVFDVLPAPPGEKPLALPDEMREYLAVMNIRESSPKRDADRVALMAKWAPILADPVAYEPTRWAPAGRLVVAAEVLDRNLIGLPGEVSGARYERDRSRETPTQILRGIPEQDGWLISRPEAWPVASRSEANAFLRNAVALGGVSVDAAAAWAAKSDGPFGIIDWVGDHVGTLLSSEGPYSASGNLMDGNGLRLWASLGKPTLDALRRGMSLDLSGLPVAARRRIERAAYWHGAISGEPTEVLPRGIEGGTVTLTVAETPLAILSTANGKAPSTMPLSSEMLGKFLSKGDKYREVDPEVYRAYDRYRMGVSRAYTLHFRLGREAIPMDLDLEETFLDPRAPTLTSLPEAFAKEVEAARIKAANAPPATP